jgi:hypothetical protein
MSAGSAHAHFQSVDTVAAAGRLVPFEPTAPTRTAGFTLDAIRVFVRDHEHREVPPTRRTVELHYGGFVVSQSGPGPAEARRLALETSYGRSPIEAQLLGRSARIYERGPEPDPDDIDGRMPAVVTWHDGAVHHLVASAELDARELIDIAMSIYA